MDCKWWPIIPSCAECKVITEIDSLFASADGEIRIDTHCPKCGAKAFKVLAMDRLKYICTQNDVEAHCKQCRQGHRRAVQPPLAEPPALPAPEAAPEAPDPNADFKRFMESIGGEDNEPPQTPPQ